MSHYDFQDMYRDVKMFNTVSGAVDEAYSLNSKQYLERLKQQLKLVQDEVAELEEALNNKDHPEILKESLDVLVCLYGFITIQKAAGVDVYEGAEEVCNNNLSKIMNNEDEAKKTVEYHASKGVASYIEEKKYYPAEWYYAVRRTSDSKVLKPYNYKKVDLSFCIPNIH